MSLVEDGFRLAGAPSDCSLKSKARIDALFEDTRSVCSTATTFCALYSELNFSKIKNLNNINNISSNNINNIEEVLGADEQKRVNSAVQARIEAMFASVEAETGIPGECAAAILPVRYLGAAPVGGRVASVRGLQEPLCGLLSRLEDSVPAELEVSRRGLTFRTSLSTEKTNPFRRIAVWSALRLRSKKLPSGDVHHAFVPLVGEESMTLPKVNNDKHADLYRTMRGLNRDDGDGDESSPPIFAVVMRRPGAVRLLECHAFLCRIEEDAVAAAATLYRALLADLDSNRRRPRQANGVGCASLASVASSISVLDKSVILTANDPTHHPPPPPRPTAPHPVRPPRIKKNSLSSARDEGNSSSSGIVVRDDKKIVEVKAEDILEGRSRRSSIARCNNPRSVSSEKDKATGCKDKSVVKASKESKKKKNESMGSLIGDSDLDEDKFKIIIDSNGKDGNLKEDGNNRYEVFKKISKRDVNSFCYSSHYSSSSSYGIRSRSASQFEINKNDNDYDKILKFEEIKKLGNGKEDEDYTVYGNNRGKSIEGRRRRSSDDDQTSNGIYYDTNRGKEFYGFKKNYGDNNFYAVSKDGEKRKSNKDIYKSCKSSGENGFYDLNRSSSKSKSKYDVEDLKDIDKILPLNSENDYQKGGGPKSTRSSSSVYVKRITDDIEIGEMIIGRENSTGVIKPLSKTTSEISFKNGFHFSEEKGVRRATSRAGSEPAKILSRSDDDPGFVKNRNRHNESRLKKAQSDLDLDGGDLMTRVELPRRGSFLSSSCARKTENFQGGTPLGFTELFDEFRNQEGLTSVDDILAAIIDPEGMSFNDLKPLYKEFLLKLAATLTRDELYERSASIMRRRRRPQRGRPTRRPGLLGRAIKRSVSRLKGGGPTEFTSVIFPARKLNDSLGSSSSCDARNARNKIVANRLSKKKSTRRRAKAAIGHTTSEDSDTCRRFGKGVTANRSSSGYVSCSECSYDSESCTCVSADKCYCSLSRNGQRGVKAPQSTTVICSCDTDSCSESNKCYCSTKLPLRQPTILEQLRQRGIVPSESTLSRAGSPKIRPVATGSSDNLALDYDLFSPGENLRGGGKGEIGGGGSCNRDKVLVVGARDSQGRLIYVGRTGRGKRMPVNSNGSRSRVHHEALSIKKNAEIAAVFANSGKISRRSSNASSFKSSVSLEAGLGYLP